MTDEPDHDDAVRTRAALPARAIEENIDLTDHMNDAVSSLRIVLAADEAVRTGRVISLTGEP